jgi:aspartate racemase
MPTVGLVGGLGPESTIDYYRRILAGWDRLYPSSMPSIVIDSLDVQTGLKLAAGDGRGLAEYLLKSVRRLEGAGCDFVAMTANTAHLVFDEVAVGARVPLISIVETCAKEAQHRGVRRPLLLGTGFTMQAPFYPAVFARHGMTIAAPNETERPWLHERYVGQLLKGDFRDETRNDVIALVERIRQRDGVDSVILGGTELPLLLQSDEVAGLQTLDTTALHVAAIIGRLQRS